MKRIITGVAFAGVVLTGGAVAAPAQAATAAAAAAESQAELEERQRQADEQRARSLAEERFTHIFDAVDRALPNMMEKHARSISR